MFLRFLLLRRIVAAAIGLVCAPWARADRAADLVHIHIEAIGGEERIAALKSIRATGEVVAGGKKMRFTLLAARPDKVRLETEGGGRTLVQGTDGQNPPWELDTGHWPPQYHDMSSAVAKTFAADAEFDDPLVAGPGRGYTVEYAGEMEGQGKKLLRLLVTRNLTETFALLLDPDTFFIVRRIEEKKNAFGTLSRVITQYDDFRPIDGVLLPHRVALVIDGKPIQETKINTVEPNPDIADDAFSRPLIKK